MFKGQIQEYGGGGGGNTCVVMNAEVRNRLYLFDINERKRLMYHTHTVVILEVFNSADLEVMEGGGVYLYSDED